MRSLRLAATLVFTTFAAIGCSSADSTEAKEPAPALEGAYYAESGPLRWSSFKGNAYVTWKSDAACNDAAQAPPASCAEHGTFALDVEQGTLTLTDAASGRVSTQTITIKETNARGALVGGAAPSSVGLIEERGQLLAPNVVSSFSLATPNQPLLQADLRTVAIVCRVVGMLLNPPTQPVIVPVQPVITVPAPVKQQQCSS